MKVSGLIAVLGITTMFGIVAFAWYVGDYSQTVGFLSERTIRGQSLFLTIIILSFLLKDNITELLKKGL